MQGMDDVQFLSFTIDPANDTPPALAAYARRFEADPARWFFLTGPAADLEKLSNDTFHLGSIGGPQLEHSSRFVLVDRKSRLRGYYDSSDPAAMEQLRTDIKALRKEVL
jgi:cytochrome oxidase Cu insertion factor (SCO1/SenC/PrrC family)